MYQKKTKSRTKISKEDQLKDAVHKLKRIVEQQRKYIKQLEEQYNIDPLEDEEDIAPIIPPKKSGVPVCEKCHKDVVIIPAGIYEVHKCNHCRHKHTNRITT